MDDVHSVNGPAADSATDSQDDGPPETGDLVVDAALRDLAGVTDDDLDGIVQAAESVHATLTSRLSDLGS